MVQSTSGVRASERVIRNDLHSDGLHGRAPRKKPFISDTEKRLAFARVYLNKPLSFWENVVFEESKFNLFGPDGRRRNEELKKQNVSVTVKHGGGNVMMWGMVFIMMG